MAICVTIDGTPHTAEDGELLAVTLIRLGLIPFRHNPVDQSPRAPFCMMGACHECLVAIDGIPNQQACLTIATDGMHVERNFA